MAKNQRQTGFTHSLTINAPAETILRAFFDHEMLAVWWRIRRSLCVPRTLGCYAVEWEETEQRDDTVGRLGGVFHGTVVSVDLQRELFVADAYWMAPEGDPVGPMAFEVTCAAGPGGTIARVRQSGSDDSPRWARYFDLAGQGMTVSLERLKTMLESR